jgi:phosphate starvation-inducible PhoH-like protein
MSDSQESIQIQVKSPHTIVALFGPQDSHRRLIERRIGVKIGVKNQQVQIQGSARALQLTQRILLTLLKEIEGGELVFLSEVERVIALCEEGLEPSTHLDGAMSVMTYDHKVIKPKTPNQRKYLEAIASHDITFGVGPAGTGKTYLAVAMAVAALKKHEIKRIILTRPAVEAGEKLGFLPGTLVEKINPYLRPLYDALHEMLGAEQAKQALEDQTIEIAPLAFMRGRTLNQAFVILDEAQNTTPEQMKMFLTRLGYSSKAVITGDLTQVDLGPKQRSGLAQSLYILRNIEGIAKIELTAVDVVRHPLVRAIIRAYDRYDQSQNQMKVSGFVQDDSILDESFRGMGGDESMAGESLAGTAMKVERRDFSALGEGHDGEDEDQSN